MQPTMEDRLAGPLPRGSWLRLAPASGVRGAACLAAVAAALPAVPQAAAAERKTVVTLEFDGVRTVGALRQRFEKEARAAKVPGKLELPNLTFYVPETEVDSAISHMLDLIARQRSWGEATALSGCGKAGTLCYVVTCRRCMRN